MAGDPTRKIIIPGLVSGDDQPPRLMGADNVVKDDMIWLGARNIRDENVVGSSVSSWTKKVFFFFFFFLKRRKFMMGREPLNVCMLFFFFK